ncbi:hypothetical protein [Bhargavaea changchunensis]|uniref:hypothetical protein n=1 Tax=Bhargavaea changchunensis TaxID=2134037 RepID=UPI00366F5850
MTTKLSRPLAGNIFDETGEGCFIDMSNQLWRSNPVKSLLLAVVAYLTAGMVLTIPYSGMPALMGY